MWNQPVIPLPEKDQWYVSPALTLVNCYGEQEGSGRCIKEEVVDRWGRLLKVLEASRLRGDHCLLIGDMNKHIGNDHLGVERNTAEISAGGRLVRDLLQGGQWRLVNAMKEVVVPYMFVYIPDQQTVVPP